jgi:hypothetical protein
LCNNGTFSIAGTGRVWIGSYWKIGKVDRWDQLFREGEKTFTYQIVYPDGGLDENILERNIRKISVVSLHKAIASRNTEALRRLLSDGKHDDMENIVVRGYNLI